MITTATQEPSLSFMYAHACVQAYADIHTPAHTYTLTSTHTHTHTNLPEDSHIPLNKARLIATKRNVLSTRSEERLRSVGTDEMKGHMMTIYIASKTHSPLHHKENIYRMIQYQVSPVLR